MRKALVIIAQEGYQNIEFDGTQQGLKAAGFEVVLASTEAGECIGKLGGREHAELPLRDVRVHEYDRIAYIGGPGAAALASDPEALRIAHEAAKLGIVLGAICVAPIILAKARVLKGRKATVFPTEQNIQILTNAGAEYTGDNVTVDGKIVTGNGPDAAVDFGKTLADL